MTSREVTVLNQAGIHASPASLIVNTAQKFQSEIWLEAEGLQINAKSIMNILALGAIYGTSLSVSAEGPDEEEAVEQIAHLFFSKFKIPGHTETGLHE